VSADEQRAADEALDRWQRVSMNDIENVFLGLIVIWVSALTVGFDSTEVAHIVLTVLFTACRVAHTVLYVFKISYGPQLGVAVWALCYSCTADRGSRQCVLRRHTSK
jgi:uncharacterized MAPEG superfamily protein